MSKLEVLQFGDGNCCEGDSCCIRGTELDKRNEVQDYYGNRVKQTADLQTSCCTSEVIVANQFNVRSSLLENKRK